MMVEWTPQSVTVRAGAVTPEGSPVGVMVSEVPSAGLQEFWGSVELLEWSCCSGRDT